MTAAEFKTYTKGLKSAYPSPNFLPDDDAMKLWYTLLQDIDYELAEAAAFKYICANKFPPTIADIREQCRAIVTAPQTKDWLDGWDKLLKLIGRYGTDRQEIALKELEAFDPVAASVARRLGWRSICMSENPTADRANFRQCYETMKKREAEAAKLPAAVNAQIAALTGGFIEKMMIGD